MARQREEVFNVELANLLGDDGLEADAETVQSTSSGTQLPDVLVDVLGLKIGIEAKFDDVSNAGAVTSKQAQQRIAANLCEVGVALLYPATIKSAGRPRTSLGAAEMRAKFFSPGREGRQWHTFRGVHELTAALRLAREQLITDDAVNASAKRMREAIEVFARAVDAQPARRSGLFGIVTAAAATHTPTSDDKSERAAVAISGLVTLTALLLQNELARFDPAVPPLPSAAPGQRRAQFVASWQDILSHDYEAVFRIAANVLSTMLDSDQLEQALVTAENVAREIGGTGVLGRHDLIGRVYHTLLADKKFLATYYTSISAATMLTELALERRAWPDVNFAAEPHEFTLRIGDLACGTGTLLAASMGVLRANYAIARAEAHLPIDSAALSRRLIEDLVYGYDVLAYAVQVCATAMLLGSPATQVQRSRLYQVPFGGESGYLGSVDFLDRSIGELRIFGGQSVQAITEGEMSEAKETELPDLDLVIMNPPFTRSAGGTQLLGSLTGPEFETARKRLAALMRRPDVRASGTAGLGSLFVELGHRAVRPGGRLALVLPKALLTGDSWRPSRDVIADAFHVEWVVTSHEAGQHNFSDSTNMSEVLLVARKWHDNEDRDDAQTRWVGLSENPDNAIEALATVAALKRLPSSSGPHALSLDGERFASEVGEVVSKPAPRDGRPWREGVFMRDALNEIGIGLLARRPIPLPRHTGPITVPLRRLADAGATIGRDVRDVHDAFEHVSTPVGYPAFWGHKEDAVRTIAQQANNQLRPRSEPAPGRKKILSAATIWAGAGKLLIAERLRLNTQRLTAVRLPERALSNTWWTVHMPDDDDDGLNAAVIALWLNSTLGMISLISLAEETEGSWVKVKKNKLDALAVPDVTALSETTLSALRSAYTDLGDVQLAPIAQAGSDPGRAAIDHRLATALGLPPDGIEAARELLSAEPRFDVGRGTLGRRRAQQQRDAEETVGVMALF